MLVLASRAAKRLGGFAASVILLAVASLLLMPATIGAAGLQIWSSIVLGQALAQIAATVVGWGYGVNGPAIVATRTPEGSVMYFRMAQRTKFAVGLPCVLLMVGAMLAIPNPDPVAGILGGAPLVINAFSAIFFYIGRAAPLWLLFAETVPRVSLMFAGAAALALGAPLLVGLTLPVIGTALGVAISYISICRSSRRHANSAPPSELGGVRVQLRAQIGPAAASMLRGGRDAIPVLLLTALATDLVAVFGIYDRVQRQALGALAPLTSALQGWVPHRMAKEASARPAIAAALAGFAAALAILAGFSLLGAPLVSWLAAGTIDPTSTEIFFCGAVIASSILVQIVGYACLVPLGGIRNVVRANVVGIVGILIALPVVASLEHSVAYALGALVIGNAAQIFSQLVSMRRHLARPPLLE
ncbi:hypothetical protein [Mycobacterium sp. IS-1496]|uniref:hypothetical protein n=1 Tax=Mycobacterium sp. IS-1496 TaxID=1772284 RepID=UPI0012F76DC3|nr:hypothetical protein [Mycobacterium sp. IS-1496]